MEPKKRSVGASERDEFLRAPWRAPLAGSLDADRLVFVDEMGANTSLWRPCMLGRSEDSGRALRCRETGVRTSPSWPA